MENLYPVGIVGESHYQRAIGQMSEGDAVALLIELDNPYSKTGTSLRVDNLNGDTIGYIADDHWLKNAVVHEKKGCQAVVLGIEGDPMGVVLEVQLTSEAIPTLMYGEKYRSLKEGSSFIVSVAKSILKRFS